MFELSKFAEQLNELMEERQLNEAALANAMGIGNSKLSLYLNAKRAPSYESFLQLLDFFHCSADYLVGNTEYPDRDKNYKKPSPFGARLNEMFAKENKSKYSFRKETNISWSILYSWLNGKSLPSLDNLVKVAEFFQISIDYLLGRES